MEKLILTAFMIIPVLGILSCNDKSNNNKSVAVTEQNPDSLYFDTTKVAVIPFEKRWTFIFDTSYAATTLTNSDLKKLDSIYFNAIKDYNSKLTSEQNKAWHIELERDDYKRQYIAVTNTKGEKMVYIYSFCALPFPFDWQHKMPLKDDGGSCVLRMTVNLTLNTIVSGLSTNGVA